MRATAGDRVNGIRVFPGDAPNPLKRRTGSNGRTCWTVVTELFIRLSIQLVPPVHFDRHWSLSSMQLRVTAARQAASSSEDRPLAWRSSEASAPVESRKLRD